MRAVVTCVGATAALEFGGAQVAPVGGTSGPTSSLVRAPQTSGSVVLDAVAAGSYVVEAFGCSSSRGTTSAPFPVG